MTEGDWIELAGDIVVFVALALTATIWVAQHSGTIRREINSTLELLRAVQDGVREWGDKYFDADYSGDNGTQRAHGDYELIMQGRDPASNFRVPTESFVVLVQQPETGLLIERRTIQAANVALERIGSFNQYVQQQTDFLALHMAEIKDPSLPLEKREPIAWAAERISQMIHSDGIRNGAWYKEFFDALEENIGNLEERLRRPQRPRRVMIRRPSRPAD